MVLQILLPKSSAKYLATRRFSQKGFVDLDFGHHRCPFSGNFLTLVQFESKKITKFIYKFCCKKREHNGLAFLICKKSDFLGRKKMTCDTPFLDIIAYFCFI